MHRYRSPNVWLQNFTTIRTRWELQMTPQEYQFMQHKRQLITGLRYFSIMLNSAYFEIKIITKDIMFYENIRIRIGKGYM